MLHPQPYESIILSRYQGQYWPPQPFPHPSTHVFPFRFVNTPRCLPSLRQELPPEGNDCSVGPRIITLLFQPHLLGHTTFPLGWYAIRKLTALFCSKRVRKSHLHLSARGQGSRECHMNKFLNGVTF